MAADPDPDPLSDPFGVATRDVRIRFRIRFGVADRIRFRIRIRIRFQLKNRPTTAKVQQEYDKKCENNSRTENVCDVGLNKVLYVLFGLHTVFCPAFKMVTSTLFFVVTCKLLANAAQYRFSF